MKNFKNINFQVVDISVNTLPDMFVNKNSISFSKKVLEDLNYPANVQFCISPEEKVFAIRVSKSNENKSISFSKPRGEQTSTISISNKNLIEVVRTLMPKGFDENLRYKVTGFFDPESRIMYFDMENAKIEKFH